MKVQYGDACLSLQQVYEWTRKFMNGVSSVRDSPRPGQAHLVIWSGDRIWKFFFFLTQCVGSSTMSQVVLVVLMLELSDSKAVLLPTATENYPHCAFVSDTSTFYT